jgi:small subunit ribosomal protein S1
MDWTNKNVNPNKMVSIGDEVEVMVLEIDEQRRRISLGMKQCQTNPWKDFAETHNKGDRISGTIKSITDFGVFVGLDGGIDGLVHLSDITWAETSDDIVQRYKKGDEIEAVVLQVDPERERISLGIKQLEQDPFAAYLANHPKGAIVTGRVTAVDQKSAVVELAEGVEGQLWASELARERVEDARTVLRVDDSVEAKIVTVDRKNRTLTLSVKAKESHEEKEAVEDYGRTPQAGSATLGDLLREQISAQKDDD